MPENRRRDRLIRDRQREARVPYLIAARQIDAELAAVRRTVALLNADPETLDEADRVRRREMLASLADEAEDQEDRRSAEEETPS